MSAEYQYFAMCFPEKQRKKKIMFTLICWSIQWTIKEFDHINLIAYISFCREICRWKSFSASEKACVLSTFDYNICIYYQVLRGMEIWCTSFKRAMQHMLCCALFLLIICISHLLWERWWVCVCVSMPVQASMWIVYSF